MTEWAFFRGGGGERVERWRERGLCATRRAVLAFSPVTSAVLSDNLSVISEIRLHKANRVYIS